MTATEALKNMQSLALEAKERFDSYGFVTSVETDYLNAMYRNVENIEKARFITVSLVIGKVGGKEGEEYCISLGAAVSRKGVDDARLSTDSEGFNKMVDEAIEVLEGYENKDEGHDFLTAKASEEYEKFLAKMEEEQKKSRKISMISNIVFIVGILLLFILAVLK